MMNAIVSTSSRMFLRWFLRLAPVLALLGAFLLGVPGTGAQEREPVDLELSMTNREVGLSRDGLFLVSVRNNSDVTVRDIRVQLEIDDLTTNRPTIFLEEHDPGTIRPEENQGTVDYDRLVWTIPNLPGGQTATTRLTTDNARNEYTTYPGPILRMQGEIVGSSPREDPSRLGNNRGRTYIRYRNDEITIAQTILLTSIRYGVDADPDTDTFTVRVINRNSESPFFSGEDNHQYELRLRVTPSSTLR